MIVTTKEMRDAVSAIGSTVPKKGDKLEFFRIHHCDACSYVDAFNGERGVRYEISASGDKIEIMMPKDRFLPLVRIAKSKEISITKEGDSAVVRSGKERYNYQTVPYVPVDVFNKPAVSSSFSAESFRAALQRVRFACDAESTRITRGILINGKNGRLTLSATDGTRIAVASIPSSGVEVFASCPVIPCGTADALISLFTSGDVSVGSSGTGLLFYGSGCSVWTTTLQGNFPNISKYMDVIGTAEEEAEIDPVEFCSAIDRVSTAADDNSHEVRIKVVSGSVLFSVASPSGNAETEIDTEYAGKGFSFNVNRKYAQQAAGVTKEKVRIGATKGKKTFMVKINEDASYTSVYPDN